MTEVEKDIFNTQKFLEEGANTFSDYYYLYNLSTENLNGYFSHLDFIGKRVLTVAGSIDHALSAFSKGARDITIFDLNKITRYYLELKKSAIRHLKREDFLNFIISDSPDYLSNNIYKTIKDDLDVQSRMFWDYFFANELCKYLFYKCEYVNYDSPDQLIPYLNSENYANLKKNIELFNPLYIHTDLGELGSKTSGQYDLIFLSNLNQFPNSFTNHGKYSTLMREIYETLLASEGELVTGYITWYNWFISLRDSSFRDYLYSKYVKRENIKLISFPSSFEIIKKDAAIVLKKD